MAVQDAKAGQDKERSKTVERLYRQAVASPPPVARISPRSVAAPGRFTATTELLLSLSGVALSIFMMMHMGLLFSVLLGARSMDALAGFLERYYLLQAGAPVLIAILLAHIVLAIKRIPTTVRQQRVLLTQIRRLGHLDTVTWGIQIVTALAIVILAAIHLWVVLTDTPIESAKSGLRVFTSYLWFYVPFIVLVEAHMSVGLYRVAVKWNIASRRFLHTVTTAWTLVAFGLGFAILVTFYRIGAGQ